MAKPLSNAVFASSGPIDLKIPGDVASLYELSQSLGTISSRLEKVADRVGLLPENLTFFWKGQTLDSFEYAAKQHAEAITPLADFAKDASSVIDAYGGLIERGRGCFADYADAAKAAGLTVTDSRYIQLPTAPTLDCATDGSDSIARQKYADQVKLFTEIRDLVGEWRADAEQWVSDFINPLIERVDSFAGIDALIRHLRDAGLAAVDAFLEAAEKRTTDDLSHFLEKQREYADKWADHKKDQRSGDHSRNARARLFDEDAYRNGKADINAKIQKLGPMDFLAKGGKAAGTLGSLAVAAYDISEGESPSKVAVGFAGGLAGGAAGAALGTAIFPGVGTLAGIGIGLAFGGAAGFFGSEGAQAFWQGVVSLRTQQAIDEGLAGKYEISPYVDPRKKDQPATYGSFR